MITKRSPVESVLPFVLIAATAVACGRPPNRAGAPSPAPLAVTVATVGFEEIADTSDVGGVVRAKATATVTARTLAPVLSLLVKAGDRVRAGQTLVVLDAQDFSARTRGASAGLRAAEQSVVAAAADERSAQAGVELARASYARIASLHDKRSATAQELDNATGSLRAAEARLAAAAARTVEANALIERARAGNDEAHATESWLRIAAPFDGIVTETLIDAGDTATPGLPLVRLEDPRSFQLEVHVDASRVRQTTVGSRVVVLLDGEAGASVSVHGTIAEVARAMDDEAHAFLVKIALPEEARVTSGMFGRLRLPGGSRRVLTVPETALIRRGQVTSVFVVDQHVARLRLVDTRGTEVLAGLSAGEVVIVTPPASIVDGRAVSEGGR